ncbi:MAG TPA: manganese efflux pump MntP family protein [Desulfobacteria bacterium]|nr:manganese efflux pump MntP family protein [Desulfobacteria bacterium]
MDWFTLLAIAVALGTDAFSLSLGMGLTPIRQRLLFAFPGIVATFHVAMPLIGMYAGTLCGDLLGRVAGLVGGLILVFIGGKTVYHQCIVPKQVFSFAQAKKSLQQQSPAVISTFSGLAVLALGVSLDALSVGFSLGTIGTQLMVSVLVIGTVAGVMTGVGLFFGKKLGALVGSRAELIGGVVLLLIGLKIIF